jgi:U3 small nucleolar RNA-associated protein 22
LYYNMPKAASSTKKVDRKAAPKLTKAVREVSVETDDESLGDESILNEDDDAILLEGSADDASFGDDDDDEDGMMDEDEALGAGDGMGDVEEDGPKAGPSKPKPNHRNLYAPPTLEELDTLSSSSSAAFNLQLSALLQSTLLPTTPHSSLKTLLTDLHGLINSIPPSAPVGPKEGIKKIGLPSISPVEFMPRKVNWTVGFQQPKEVFVSGSWSVVGGYKVGKGEQGGVDMVLVMPDVRYFTYGGNCHANDVGAVHTERQT